MTTRIAPDGGYSFEEKAGYRRFVWDAIASRSQWREPGQAVLLMPSLEGLEIDEALSRGFRERDLHIVDLNPAIVATLKRDRYRQVTGYGVSVHRAHRRIAKAGLRLYGASIDLCSTSSWKTSRELAVCSDADCWQSGARVVVNVLRGRESARTRQSVIDDEAVRRCAWFQFLLERWDRATGIEPTVRDLWRVFMLAVALPNHVAVVHRIRPYVSSNGQSFLTIAFVMNRARDIGAILNVNGAGLVPRGSTAQGRAAHAFVADLALRNALTVVTDLKLDEHALIPVWVPVLGNRRMLQMEVGSGNLSHRVWDEAVKWERRYRGGVFGAAMETHRGAGKFSRIQEEKLHGGVSADSPGHKVINEWLAETA